MNGSKDEVSRNNPPDNSLAAQKSGGLKKRFIIIAVTAAVCLAVFLLSSGEKTSREIFYAMDTTVTVKLWNGKNSDYEKLVKKLEKLFDGYDEKSDIYKINNNKSAKVSDFTAQLLSQSKALCEKYPQCDITVGSLTELWKVNAEGYVPSEEEIENALSHTGLDRLSINKNTVSVSDAKIDVGCTAKGFACDVLKKELDKNGEKCAIISFGSSTLLYGEKPDGKSFTVSVSNPVEKNKSLGTLLLEECFVSTSGGYERFFEKDGKTYSHIFDVKTGRPAKTDLLSVTVISDSGILTDFLSTCIYISGTEGLGEFFNDKSIEIIAVDENRNIYVSKSLKDRFELKNKDFTLILL